MILINTDTNGGPGGICMIYFVQLMLVAMPHETFGYGWRGNHGDVCYLMH